MPQFPGGDDSLLLYLGKNLKYPTNESLQNIQGKVVCRFLINKNGSVSNIEVLRSLDPILDTLAINLIKSMPDFIPGRQKGKIVRTYYTLPIHFKTQE
jgi:protein TonB